MTNEEKENLFTSTLAQAREEELRRHYHLEPLRERSSRHLYLKALWLLTVWEKAVAATQVTFPAEPGGELQVVDVGSLGWDYVFALERFCTHFPRAGVEPYPRRVHLLGVEINGRAWDRYGVRHTNRAQAHLTQTGNPQVRYRVGDFLQVRKEELHSGGADLITLLYPFLFRYGVLLWGLPSRFHQPEAILKHATTLLKPGGMLLVLLHTAAEQEQLLAFATRLPELLLAAAAPAHCHLFPHGDPRLLAARHYTVLIKTG